MGDCGLMDDGDLYGVFLPHNIWAVYADRLALEAAEILGRTGDIDELRQIHDSGRADLLAALDRGAIREGDYRWMPGVPAKTSGSRWGVLNALHPCQLLPPEHELISGTIRKIESNLSPGGLPIHTGWLADGMWVAITLDNLAEAHLVRHNGDAAARYLYATLNHATPLVTWCEERGPEPGASKCTGDRQHLWTPVAVVRCRARLSCDGRGRQPRACTRLSPPLARRGRIDPSGPRSHPFRPRVVPIAARQGDLKCPRGIDRRRRGASIPSMCGGDLARSITRGVATQICQSRVRRRSVEGSRISAVENSPWNSSVHSHGGRLRFVPRCFVSGSSLWRGLADPDGFSRIRLRTGSEIDYKCLIKVFSESFRRSGMMVIRLSIVMLVLLPTLALGSGQARGRGQGLQ